jgi:hypothetical protein
MGMKTLKFLMRYGWLLLLVVSLVSYLPLALHAEMVGGIPNWVYWGLGMVLTILLIIWLVVGLVYNFCIALNCMGKDIKKNASKSKGMGGGGVVAGI